MAQRESILSPLSNSIYIKIRQDFLELCDGDHCMAALLSYYEYKLNAIISNMEEMKLKNKSYTPSADDYFIECSPSFLSKALLGLFGRTKIIEANEKLHEQNFITIKTEKIGNQYKTTRIALNIEPIKKSLLTLFENGQPLIQKQTTPYSDLNNPLFGNEQPPCSEMDRISNTTNKENKENTSKQSSDTFLFEIEQNKSEKMDGFILDNKCSDFVKYFGVANGFRKIIIEKVKSSGGSIEKLNDAKIGTWVKPIRDMYVLDKIDGKNIEAVYKWLPTSEFWSKNILSTQKLREKFNQLIVEAKKSTPVSNRKSIYG